MSHGDTLGVALCDVSGPLNDFNQKLTGPDGEKWLRAFKKFLRKEDPWRIVASDFPVWATIQLGSISFRDLLPVLVKEDCDIDDSAMSILKQAKIAKSRRVIHLAMLSPEILGFCYSPTYEKICDAAFEMGFLLCPAEVAPRLIFQRKAMLPVRYVIVAMDPVLDRVSKKCILYSSYDGSGSSISSVSTEGRLYSLQAQFVFEHPNT